jgi:hypothetical protein
MSGLCFLISSTSSGHIIGIDLGRFNPVAPNVAGYLITFLQRAAGQHNIGKYLGNSSTLAGYHVAYPACSNNQYFAHNMGLIWFAFECL